MGNGIQRHFYDGKISRLSMFGEGSRRSERKRRYDYQRVELRHEHSRLLTAAKVSMWSYWLLSCCMRCTNNEGLTDNSNNLPKRAYAIRNYSLFVQPGWVRVGVTNRGALLLTAFQNASGTRHAIVVVNNSGSEVAGHVFSVSTNMRSSGIP
jgi:hypothetical protein